MKLRSKTEKNPFVRLIEASVEELMELEVEGEFGSYRRALLAFHRGDAVSLKREWQACADEKFKVLIELRWRILAGEVASDNLRYEAAKADDAVWKGEFLLLLATAQTVLGDHVVAKASFEKAAKALREAGAAGKALRADLNVIVAESNIDPERKFLPEYHYLYRRAKKAGQWLVAATALLNLSREYQKLGALKIALKTCNQGLRVCRDHVASQIFFLLLAHRAHLFFQLGRTIEAATDLEQAQTADDPTVKSACAVLEELFHGKQTDESGRVLATWRERLEEYRALGKIKKPALSAQEEALLVFLAEKPREKFEICDHLFGADVHPFTTENRLKNLLGRVRKKFPGLIVFDQDRYSIVDDPAGLERSKKEKDSA